tara:strand:+ start:246 stop:566 length:321 start_codon:yes stop_codon:yes gene_type:complete
MDKELVKAFVQEYKEEQEWKKRCRDNHIDFNNYFKYSGKVEEEKVLISHWAYDFNHKCNAIHEQFIKTENYEKIWKDKANKNYPGRFTKEITTYSREKTKNSVWSD